MEKKSTFIFDVTIVLVILNHFWVCLAANHTSLNTDQDALVAIRAQITVDPSGILSTNWTTNTSICTWTGVTCGSQFQTRRILALDLSNMGLVGSISPHIGNLSFLTLLDITNNSFHGEIPSEIMGLRHLEEVYMGYNNLNGNLPKSYSNDLPKLEILFLDNNNLTGTLLPFFLDSMPNLKTLALNHNSLHGNIPEEIGKRSRLQDLSMNNNQLTGLVPSAVFNLSSLRKIDLAANLLSGSLPPDMCDALGKLELLLISLNKFTGSIPRSIDKCQQLRYLSISMNEFSGSIPREVGNLTLLEQLFLGLNDLEGSIPAEIGNLKRLEQISIYAGNLVGEIPHTIFNISSLKMVDFSNNSLSGVLPSNTYINLEELYLSDNQLIGEIPSGIWRLKGIRMLSLSVNYFIGNIPPEIGNLTQLTNLYLGRNLLTGVIPDELYHHNHLEELSLKDNSHTGSFRFNISTLRVLALGNNSFSGHLPADMGFWLPNLQLLLLGLNEFRGVLPASIINASELSRLDLSFNSFSGSIPATIGRLEMLELLSIGVNNFTSDASELTFLTSVTNCRKLRTLAFALNPFNAFLPASIGNLSTSLETIQGFGCGIRGEIPSGVGNLTSLRSLSLDMNELEGYIPQTLGNLQNIGELFLEHNRLQGGIPQDICFLKNLGELCLNDNQLSGIIPPCLGDIDSLTLLLLGSNNLTSTIPSRFWTHKALLVLNLSSNLLTGQIPASIGGSNALLTELDLSFNRISGDIPSSIGGYQMLTKLSLARNKLQGSIPESLGTIISLELLDLSHNNLSGAIPRSLESLRYLKNLNLSFNMLEGEIPSGGWFSNFTASSFTHNKGLCGAEELEVSACKSGQNESRVLSYLKHVVPIIASAIVLVLAVHVWRRHRKHIRTNVEPPRLHEWTRVSYYELVRATESFDGSNLIGQGSYGSVFKGMLSDGVIVAVKVFNLLSERAVKSFDDECQVLRNIRHRNLVRIISSCTNLDFRCLVMEYMSNGSLEQWLYSHNNNLSLQQRLQVTIDVASALEYLHHGQTTPIIHCDLKPSNILLDEDMNARVCDFGISKIFGEQDFMLKTTTLGTIGYMAPEYGTDGIVSIGGDVYSFGIVLLETFTRKKPTDEMFSGELSLRNWVLQTGQHSIFDILDVNLIDEHVSIKGESVASIFTLAMDCTSESSSRRTNMEETVVRLRKIQKTFLASA